MAEHVRIHDAAQAGVLTARADDARQQRDALRKLIMARDPLAAAEP
jgi:hypothetical protein